MVRFTVHIYLTTCKFETYRKHKRVVRCCLVANIQLVKLCPKHAGYVQSSAEASGPNWDLWHQPWCHRGRFSTIIGTCGTSRGATETVSAPLLGPVAPAVVPQRPFQHHYWDLWHQPWCHRHERMMFNQTGARKAVSGRVEMDRRPKSLQPPCILPSWQSLMKVRKVLWAYSLLSVCS